MQIVNFSCYLIINNMANAYKDVLLIKPRLMAGSCKVIDDDMVVCVVVTGPLNSLLTGTTRAADASQHK